MHPSPGSHRYCDELVNRDNPTVQCSCDCHTDMAPFDEFDAQLIAHYAKQRGFDPNADSDTSADSSADEAQPAKAPKAPIKPAKTAPKTKRSKK